MTLDQRNVVSEIGNLIEQKGHTGLASIWKIKASGYDNLCVSEQVKKLVQQYRPIILNIEGVSQTAQAVMHEAYYSEAWIKNFKQHVVPILIKYGVA